MSLPVLPVLAVAAVGGILVASSLAPVLPVPWTGWLALAVLALAGPIPRGRIQRVAAVVALVAAARFSAADADRRDRERAVRAAAAGPELSRVGGVVRAVLRRAPDRLVVSIRDRETGGRVRVSIYADGDRALPALLPGDRIAARGRLRPAPRYRLPGAAPIPPRADARLSAPPERVAVLERDALVTGRRLAARIQRRLVRWVDGRGGPAGGRAVVRAAVTGDRGGMPRQVARALREAGAGHVLAVSGLHLAAVAGLAFAGARRLAAAVPGLVARCSPARIAAAIAAPVAIGYTVITGAHTSTVRALVAVLAALAAASFDRRPRASAALAIAALALLLADPHDLFRPSFQLSFCATFALVVAAGRRPRGAAGRVAALVRTSALAAAATAPAAALAFGQVALAGPVANLVAVPLASLAVIPLGLAGAALAPLSPAAGGAVTDLAIVAGEVIVRAATAAGAVLPAVPVPPPGPLELAGLAAAAAAAWAGARRRWPARRAAATAAVAIAAVALSVVGSRRIERALAGDVRVTFVEVGQGDAAVIELPDGGVWLVDAGGRPVFADDLSPAEGRRVAALPGERAVLRTLRRRRIRAIDRAILSHPHPDHYAGLAAVARAVPIREVWVPRAHLEHPPALAYRALLARLAVAGTRVVHPPLGLADRRAGVALAVLAPAYRGEAAADPVHGANDNSLVVRLDYAGRRILFTGDLEAEAERMLVARARPALAADLVKVPHHGSATSSTRPLVAASSPRWAVISCGVGNRYGFPAKAVVARWRRAGARVVTTSAAGSITARIAPGGRMRVEVADPPL